MKTLYIITGHSGAGKTTKAKELMKEKNIVHHYEADMWMTDSKGNYSFDPKKLGYCHKQCFESVKRAMKDGFDVVQSNTNLFKKHVKPYIELAKQFGYDVVIKHQHGNFKNAHGVPDEKINDMKKNRELFDLKDF